MPKKNRIRGNLRKNDSWRVVLTDTSPFEVPVIFSNDGFYKNLQDWQNKSGKMQNLLENLFASHKPYTIPYRYNIVKGISSFRPLSLLHPGNQRQIAKFYKTYDQLITYYCSGSPFSIRYPHKIGSSYFFTAPISDKNKYKNNTVNTSDIDHLLRNPASYFSYKFHDRLHKFFKSKDYLHLEKKYSLMTMLDVSKCFPSIYTHSISWALKDINMSKEYKSANTFGNCFDNLMQSGNFNETNGICIGPETSRIFAEIIFSKIDKNVESRLSDIGLNHKIHYECRRYVDDYFIFCSSKEHSTQIQRAISISLREFNLYLNEGKTEDFNRPFYTQKSQVTDKVSKGLEEFAKKFIESLYISNRQITFPNRIKNHQSLANFLIKEVKISCYESKSGYDVVSNYVISALCKRVLRLVEDYEYIAAFNADVDSEIDLDQVKLDRYHPALVLLLDLIFFYFTVHPTAYSSLRVANALLSSGKFLKKYVPEHHESLCEYALRWTEQLIHAPSLHELVRKDEVVPIELLNILVSLTDLSSGENYEKPLIEKATSLVQQKGYFDIICRLYIYRDTPFFNNHRKGVLAEVKKMLFNETLLIQSSQHIHLLLDVLSCPYIDVSDRINLLKELWPILQKQAPQLSSLKSVSPKKLVAEFEVMPWFVNWHHIDLLNLIEKKELSAVY